MVVAQTSEVGTIKATLKMPVETRTQNDVNTSFINSNGNSGCKVQSESVDTEYTQVVTIFQSFYA